jgi:Arylsulfotransferase (ASST)
MVQRDDKQRVDPQQQGGGGPGTGGSLSRRQLLAGGTVAGLGVLAGAGVIGYAWPRPAAGGSSTTSVASSGASSGAGAGTQQSAGVHYFVSRQDLQPPVLAADVVSTPSGLPEYVFLANKPYKGGYQVGQCGLLIAGRDGDVTWFSPIASGQVLDFNVQSYRGANVLTWWHGTTGAAFGQGTCYIADSSYTQIAAVQCGNGLKADMHEFNITAQGTALIDSYQPRQNVDLTAVGGKANGAALSGVVQEIDIATGEVIFQWSSLDHVPISETQATLSGTGTADNPFDYFHINSIDVAADGDLLVSSRNTWTVYKIGRHDGQIKWRLGGKKSNFTLGPGVQFHWQHHVRAHGINDHGEDILTIFDNGSSPPLEPQSRGLLLNLDTKTMRATLQFAYTSPVHPLADNQGSIQLLPGNGAFVGWGAEPYYTEFDADGTVLMNGQLPMGDQSYRAFTYDWTGQPKDRPAVVVELNVARAAAVYVSWNGATEVQTWRVHAGKRESSLSVVATQPRTSFETVIAADSTGPYFMVTAHDASGKQIGQSAVVEKKGLTGA